jgi:hypothetical protein
MSCIKLGYASSGNKNNAMQQTDAGFFLRLKRANIRAIKEGIVIW